MSGYTAWIGLGELPGVSQIGGLGLHPQHICERGRGKGFRDRVRDSAANLVVALRGPGQLTVPRRVDTEFCGLALRGVERRGLGEFHPLGRLHRQGLAFALLEPQHIGDGIAVGVQSGVVLPGVDELRLDLVEQRVQRLVAIGGPVGGRLVDQCGESTPVEPGVGRRVLAVGQCVEQMAVEFGHTLGVQAAQHGQEAGLVRRDCHVGHPEQERLIAFVGPAVDEVGGFCVRAGDDDAGHLHDVELEARGVETLDLLIGRHQHLAALVTALLGAGPLILDVIAGDTGFDEAPDQIAHMRITAMAGVGVGDDERPVVNRRRGGPLLVCHLHPQELLVAVGGEQRPHQSGRLVGNLAQRVAGEIGARILVGGALGRGGPPAEVDALDAAALHRDGLPGGVRSEGGDRLVLAEQLTQPRVERLRRLPCHRVVHADRSALLDHLAGGVEPRDPGEPRAVEIPLGLGHLVVEIRSCCGVRFDGGHGRHAPRQAGVGDTFI